MSDKADRTSGIGMRDVLARGVDANLKNLQVYSEC